MIPIRHTIIPTLLCVIVIGAIFFTGCTTPLTRIPKSDTSTTELRVHYNGNVTAHYGSGDCVFKGDIPGDKVIRFSNACIIDYAYFNVTRNGTNPGVFRVDLVRKGEIIKTYSTEGSSVSFKNIDEFLSTSERNPGLVLNVPITVKVITDGTWYGEVTDKYGAQSGNGDGPATLTLDKLILPVKACIQNRSASNPITVEMYEGDTLLNRSEMKNTQGYTCVTTG